MGALSHSSEGTLVQLLMGGSQAPRNRSHRWLPIEADKRGRTVLGTVLGVGPGIESDPASSIGEPPPVPTSGGRTSGTHPL